MAGGSGWDRQYRTSGGGVAGAFCRATHTVNLLNDSRLSIATQLQSHDFNDRRSTHPNLPPPTDLVPMLNYGAATGAKLSIDHSDAAHHRNPIFAPAWACAIPVLSIIHPHFGILSYPILSYPIHIDILFM